MSARDKHKSRGLWTCNLWWTLKRRSEPRPSGEATLLGTAFTFLSPKDGNIKGWRSHVCPNTTHRTGRILTHPLIWGFQNWRITVQPICVSMCVCAMPRTIRRSKYPHSKITTLFQLYYGKCVPFTQEWLSYLMPWIQNNTDSPKTTSAVDQRLREWQKVLTNHLQYKVTLRKDKWILYM